MSLSKSTSARLDTHEAVCEERWKETIIRIRRLEHIVLGSGGATILLLVGLLLKQGVIIDPVTAIATATTAFNLIKKGFQAGRDVEGMYGDIGRWMGAISDVNHAEKMSKNPPLFKKLFAGSSVEQEAMDAFASKKKAEAMEEELRNWINLTHGPNAWNELLKMQIKIRKQRQDQVYAQQEFRKKVIEIVSICVGATIVGAGLIWIIYLVYQKRTNNL